MIGRQWKICKFYLVKFDADLVIWIHHGILTPVNTHSREYSLSQWPVLHHYYPIPHFRAVFVVFWDEMWCDIFGCYTQISLVWHWCLKGTISFRIPVDGVLCHCCWFILYSLVVCIITTKLICHCYMYILPWLFCVWKLHKNVV